MNTLNALQLIDTVITDMGNRKGSAKQVRNGFFARLVQAEQHDNVLNRIFQGHTAVLQHVADQAVIREEPRGTGFQYMNFLQELMHNVCYMARGLERANRDEQRLAGAKSRAASLDFSAIGGKIGAEAWAGTSNEYPVTQNEERSLGRDYAEDAIENVHLDSRTVIDLNMGETVEDAYFCVLAVHSELNKFYSGLKRPFELELFVDEGFNADDEWETFAIAYNYSEALELMDAKRERRAVGDVEQARERAKALDFSGITAKVTAKAVA